jgi:hypothetical protein
LPIFDCPAEAILPLQTLFDDLESLEESFGFIEAFEVPAGGDVAGPISTAPPGPVTSPYSAACDRNRRLGFDCRLLIAD